MTNNLKKKIDFIPLIILFVSAGYTLMTYFLESVYLHWQHYIGFGLLLITLTLFFFNHKLGVISLGFTIVLGLVGLLQITPGIMSASISKPIGEESYLLLKFNPLFLLWLVLHFAISKRYYTGIITSKYWKEINSDEPYKID